MPLSIKKPTKDQFLPLIEKVERRLGGWKDKLISRGGRLQLVRSVLSSIPIYHMTCFKLLQWVVCRIDRIGRRFLRGKSKENERGISLINWQTACLPRIWGSLCISNLHLTNISLFLRWLWKLYHEPSYLLSSIVYKLCRRSGATSGPPMWIAADSFFWKQLQALRDIFISATLRSVGDGRNISYWFDHWQGLSKARSIRPRLPRSSISLRNVWPIRQVLQPDVEQLSDSTISFTDQSDQLLWKWSNSGIYTASLAYKTMVGGGKIKLYYEMAWHCAIPPTVKVFTFLMLQGRILPKDVLAKRGMFFQRNCVLCGNYPVESILHLLFLCPFAINMWFDISRIIGVPLMKPAQNLHDIWNSSWSTVKRKGSMKKKEWMARFLCVVWKKGTGLFLVKQGISPNTLR